MSPLSRPYMISFVYGWHDAGLYHHHLVVLSLSREKLRFGRGFLFNILLVVAGQHKLGSRRSYHPPLLVCWLVGSRPHIESKGGPSEEEEEAKLLITSFAERIGSPIFFILVPWWAFLGEGGRKGWKGWMG